jgi:hypothetical protein
LGVSLQEALVRRIDDLRDVQPGDIIMKHLVDNPDYNHIEIATGVTSGRNGRISIESIGLKVQP